METRTVRVDLVLSGETFEDYSDASNAEVLEAFKNYYDITRPDFTLQVIK